MPYFGDNCIFAMNVHEHLMVWLLLSRLQLITKPFDSNLNAVRHMSVTLCLHYQQLLFAFSYLNLQILAMCDV